MDTQKIKETKIKRDNKMFNTWCAAFKCVEKINREHSIFNSIKTVQRVKTVKMHVAFECVNVHAMLNLNGMLETLNSAQWEISVHSTLMAFNSQSVFVKHLEQHLCIVKQFNQFVAV